MSSRKKVIVRKFSRDWQSGYVEPQDFVREGRLELLDLTGKVSGIALREIKMVCFVRDFLTTDPANPERLVRRTFSARPRSAGIWIRLHFRDGDQLEGIASNDLTLLDPDGIQLTPPDTRSNTQRVFVPRTALEALQVVSVIGSGTRRKLDDAGQEHLFAS
ncbi:MAG TPA: hypothetical protein VHX63_08025 [Acidobacteriaceae bacterium]|jgi:hypothetical protein|nr:hypothetical protein [Acidobacteriaceae bacterium]